MTLENINYVAQSIAVPAILVSLVFVGIQVRQNTEQAQRAHLLAVSNKAAEHQDRIVALWHLGISDGRLAAPLRGLLTASSGRSSVADASVTIMADPAEQAKFREVLASIRPHLARIAQSGNPVQQRGGFFGRLFGRNRN